MEIGFVFGLVAITLLVIGLVIHFGAKLNRAVLKQAPESMLALRLSLTGTALRACIVAFWLICLVAGKLRPDTSFGAFVGTVDGMGTVVVGSVFFAGIAAAISEKFGYPIATRSERP